MRWRFVLPILALSIPVLSLTWPQKAPQIVSEAPRSASHGIVGTLPMTDPDEQYAQIQLAGFYAGVQRDVDAYLDALEAQRRADEEAAKRARNIIPVSRPSVGSTVGDCTGFSIPDYIIQRESGGNPSAYNPSGAYGCAQTLLSHYSEGTCAGLDPYTIDGQRECVWRLSNGGTNLSPWAMTR